MSWFGSFWAPRKPRLEPDWMVSLPPRLGPPAASAPRALIDGDTVVAWGEGLAIGIDASSGHALYRTKLGGWTAAGFAADGRPIFRNGARTGWLEPATGAVREDGEARPDEVRSARDAPEHPEVDPTLRVGRRVYRVRTETRSRVTRHWIEISDEGHVLRRVEVAGFTLRSDRLVLTDRGGGNVYGWVGMDSECPAGAVTGSGSGPVVVLRRRFPGWHEHSIPEDEPDLLGHGPAHLSVMIVNPDEPDPRSRELGTAPETWEGLGWRGGPHPPYLRRALGARPVGLAAGRVVVELSDLVDGTAASTRLAPKRRYLAGFLAGDLA